MTRRTACIVRPMNHAKWQDSADPYLMLQHLERSCYSVGRLRLAACACCRVVWGLITDRRSRRAVKVAEWLADGRASKAEITHALEEAKEAAEWAETRPANEAAQAALRALAGPSFADVARHVTWLAAWRRTLALPGPCRWQQVWPAACQVAERRLCSLIRRFFPSPNPLPARPAWLACGHRIAPGLARTIAEGQFELLPILADVFEEAGCDSGEVLAHLRWPGRHAAGCWLVRLVLREEKVMGDMAPDVNR